MPTIFAVKATGTGSAPGPVVATTPAPTVPVAVATGTGLAPAPAVSTNAPTISAVVATGTGLAVAPEANLSPTVQAVVAKGTGRAPEPGINLLTYFTLRGYIKTVVADEADPDFDPEIKGVNATVTITPKASGFDVIQAVTQAPPALVILSPIKARIDDGRMMLIAGQVDVRLVANTPVLGLGTAPLVYKVEFTNVVFNQETQQIASFEFAAPTSDTVIDIASVPRVSASPTAATIFMQGPPGPTGATGPAGTVADGSVTTPKIVDGNVTSAKLSTGVQTSLGKADTAYQAPTVVAAGATPAAARTVIAAAGLDAASNVFTGKMELNGIGSGPPFGYNTALWIAPSTRTNPPTDTQGIYVQHRVAGNLNASVNDAVIAELRLWDATNSGPGQQALEASLVVTAGTGIPNNIGNMNAVTANFHTEGAAIGTAANVSMLRGQQIPALAAGFTIGTACSLTLEQQTVGTTNYTLYAPAGRSLLGPTQVGDLTIVDPNFSSNGNVRDSSGNILLVLGKGSAAAVNYIQINNAATGQYPTLYSQGSDPNIDFVFWPKGAGLVRVVNGLRMDGDATIKSGTGSPAGIVAAPVGSVFLRTDGGATSTLYVKESGSGNTGWVAK